METAVAASKVGTIQTSSYSRLGRSGYGGGESLDEKQSSANRSFSVPLRTKFYLNSKMQIALFPVGRRCMNGTLSSSNLQTGTLVAPRVGASAQYRGGVKKLESAIWGKAIVTTPSWRKFVSGNVSTDGKKGVKLQVVAGEAQNATKVNLHQYMVTLDHTTGIRFAHTSSGKIFVDALAKNGNAERTHMVMVGDVLKKVSAQSGDDMVEVQEFEPTMKAIKERNGQINLILERSPPSFQSSRSTQDEVIGLSTDDENDNIEWTHGNFNKQEYESALERADIDLCYNPALGMNYSKITEYIYVGSCIQEEKDVHQLVDKLGVTAVLNLQRKSEQDNWGIDGEAIEKLARDEGLVVVNCPIRDVDAVDLRRKLPFAVGLLYRLLRKGNRVFVTCTTGLDRSPACVIAYLHWIQDVALQEAVDYIKKLHPCGPDRPALVWATWDLIAMAEREDHKGPPTHAVQFVWNHGCRDGEEVLLVGEFKGGWNEPIKAVHASGPKYTVDLRLPQGKYKYKFIVGGHWRHSSSLPTEGDEWGNINNVLKIGDVATTKFDTPHRPQIKDLNTIKVIERPLTEDERFTLAFASRRMALAIDPFTLAPKK
ncbi:unnamed protein product [Calypogeia fissa]